MFEERSSSMAIDIQGDAVVLEEDGGPGKKGEEQRGYVGKVSRLLRFVDATKKKDAATTRGQYAAGRSDRNVESGEHYHGVPNC